MPMRLCRRLAACAAIVCAASTALADSKLPRHTLSGVANFPEDSISVLTEGLSASTGHDDDRITELARAFAADGLPRVLPVAGLGPISNARDLLHMRGIDLAVIDADIITYAKLDRELLGQTTALTQVLKLSDKTVYLVAGPQIHELSELAHQKVLALGEDSDGHVTARSLFSLLGIDAVLGSADLASATLALTDQSAKALVLVASSRESALAGLPRDKGLHLLPIPPSDALDKVYTRTTISQAEALGFAPPEGVPSVSVASLLATYNWRPNLYRFGPVQQFLHALPAVLMKLRQSDPSGFWPAVDTRSPAPGWQIYEGAATALASVAPAATPLPKLATVVATAPSGPPTPVAFPSVPERPAKSLVGGIDLFAFPLPGLTDPKSPGGGLVAELVTASLQGEALHLTWAADAGDAAAKLQAGKGARLGLTWKPSDCEAKGEKADCDRLVFSKPLFRALDVFFVRRGSDFSFQRDDDVAGHSVCAAANADVASLDSVGRRWLKQELITLLRKPTLAMCLDALKSGAVDAVFGDQLAGQEQIAAGDYGGQVDVVDRPVAMRELSVAALKLDAGADDLIGRVNAGMAALKANGRYAQMVLAWLRPAATAHGVQTDQ